MGEHWARGGYGYQDKVATQRILEILRNDAFSGEPSFDGVRLADIDAGRVDDFVLVWRDRIEGNSIKWSVAASPINWGELIGANGLIAELADGYGRLKKGWPTREVSVSLQTNRPPSTSKHKNQLVSAFSVAEFLAVHWPNGPTESDDPALTETWSKIQKHTRLNGEEFAAFVKACRFVLSHPEPEATGPDTRDGRHYKRQFDCLHKAIATWISNHPDEPVITSRYLFDAIEFRGYQPGLIQRFPDPVIPYSRNAEAARSLTDLIERVSGGYIAVVGQAGIGKSTLVQDVLRGPEHPFFIPYYAFLPDGRGSTRDRSEALTFFQDIISRLEKLFGKRASLGISDIAEGREALREMMDRAHEQFVVQGRKTILLIDGIDHIAREVHLQASVLTELPDPADVPEGFIIVLGSQPQALEAGSEGGSVSPSVAHSVRANGGRRVSVDALSRESVFDIASKFEKPIATEQRAALFDSCSGNPLILTYVLNRYGRDDTVTLDNAIEELGSDTGDIEQYYAERLSTTLADPNNRKLLGLIARSAPTTPVRWLMSWPEKPQVEHLYTHTLSPFVKEEDGNLFFIHNSLVSFLRTNTRSPLPGGDLHDEERAFYSELADRCQAEPCSEAIGRARVLHLHKAGRQEELLDMLSSDWLRGGSSSFVPYSLLRPLILAGLESAWLLGRYGDVLRLTLVDFELDQRTSRIEGGQLASLFLDLGMHDLAISQIRASGRILVSESVALEFCKDLWFYGVDRQSNELKETARKLYLESKPIKFIQEDEEIDTHRHHDYYQILRNWSEAAPLFEPLSEFVDQVKGLKFKVVEFGDDVNEASVKSGLLYRALLTMLEVGATFAEVKHLLDAICDIGEPGWIFASLMICCHMGVSGVTDAQLADAFALSSENVDFRLAYAQHLSSTGNHNEAAELTATIRQPRLDPTRKKRSLGFSDVTFISELRCLQARYKIDDSFVLEVSDADHEALARVEWAARELGNLRALSLSEHRVDLVSAFRGIILFENHRVVLDEVSARKGYLFGQYKGEILEELVSVAESFGGDGLSALKEVILGLVDYPSHSILYPQHRRYLASALFRLDVIDRHEAKAVGLSNTDDASDEDPMQRQEACLEIATFLHGIGDLDGRDSWIASASVLTAGAGSHKDYHMSDLADWLTVSVDSLEEEDQFRLVEKFLLLLPVAGGAGQADAAYAVTELVMRFHPGKASQLAIELVDRDVLNLSSTVESLMLAASKAGASTDILVAIYAELASLIDPGTTRDAAKAVAGTSHESSALALELMRSVRTNALPDARIGIARALQDLLIEKGQPAHIETTGLGPGRDDRSLQSSLYRLSSGETLTRQQMVALLSTNVEPGEWNPNPDENNHFDWWHTLKSVEVVNKEHLDKLTSTFSIDDHRQVEFLAWKAKALLRLNERGLALATCRTAVDEARDGSWYDGAQKIAAFSALKELDHQVAIDTARTQFGRDLAHGLLTSKSFLAYGKSIFDFLELDWPSQSVRLMLEDYCDEVIQANPDAERFVSIRKEKATRDVDQALCEFLIFLVDFPVVDVGVGARRALARYVISSGDATKVWQAAEVCAGPTQWEHVLIAIHLAAIECPESIRALEARIREFNCHESLATRSVARRICEEQGWDWTEITNERAYPQIILPNSNLTAVSIEETDRLVDAGPAVTAMLYGGVFQALDQLDSDDAQSELLRLYHEIERKHPWSEKNRFEGWMNRTRGRLYTKPHATVGREASMRLLGRRALTGQAHKGVEQAYNSLYPLYDAALELRSPTERPAEMTALDFDLWDERGKKWLAGEGASDWDSYPTQIGPEFIIAERSTFVRPEWALPCEERVRGLAIGPVNSEVDKDVLATHSLVYTDYLQGRRQRDDQLTIWNAADQMVGPQYRWCAMNANVARLLGWAPGPDEPFAWENSAGDVMVRSIYWRDGWTSLQPPEFDSLGEGWVVVASEEALQQIYNKFPSTHLHLWVERHSGGDNPYDARWHLSRLASA